MVVGLPAAAERVSQIVAERPAPGGERRAALVIGNSAYRSAPLRNPVNDARDMAAALARTGFNVTLVEDASLTGMRRAIRSFGDELTRGGIGLFYYAGHGVQLRGRNFLLPVNADIAREDEIEDQTVDANLVLSKMDTARNTLNLVILDACRNNPYQRAYRSVSQGLAQMDAPTGTLIAFATAPGRIAYDGDGRNGVYTKYLLKQLGEPGLPIEQLFKQVRIGVSQETLGRQIPWESSSLKGDFFFVAPDPAQASAAQKAALERAVSDAVKREQERAAAERLRLEDEMKALVAQLRAKHRAEIEVEAKQRAPDDQRVTARKPATDPPPQAPASTAQPQIAALSVPKPQHGATISRLPRVGDRWQYRNRLLEPVSKVATEWRTSPWVEVHAVADNVVIDRWTPRGGTTIEAVREPDAAIVGLTNHSYILSPYLHVQQSIKPGDVWPNLPIHKAGNCSTNPAYDCKFSARVVKLEQVTVPAGTFEAYRVEIRQIVIAAGTYERMGTFWFAPAAKRYVKMEWQTLRGNWRDPNTEVELVALALE